MVKSCIGCGKDYKGWGDKCAECRKTNSGPSPVVNTGDLCFFCKKKVYVMEKVEVSGLLLHKDCFRCETCKCKLMTGRFSKAPQGNIFYCPTHFKEIFRLRGRYETTNDELQKRNLEHGGAEREYLTDERILNGPVSPNNINSTVTVTNNNIASVSPINNINSTNQNLVSYSGTRPSKIVSLVGPNNSNSMNFTSKVNSTLSPQSHTSPSQIQSQSQNLQSSQKNLQSSPKNENQTQVLEPIQSENNDQCEIQNDSNVPASYGNAPISESSLPGSGSGWPEF